jgi:hypothetical protein
MLSMYSFAVQVFEFPSPLSSSEKLSCSTSCSLQWPETVSLLQEGAVQFRCSIVFPDTSVVFSALCWTQSNLK